MTDKDWIPVEEGLPDDKGKRYGIEVLAVLLNYDTSGRARRSKVSIAFKDGAFRHGWWREPISEKLFQRVTHWMYWPDLPKKYKKSDNEKRTSKFYQR